MIGVIGLAAILAVAAASVVVGVTAVGLPALDRVITRLGVRRRLAVLEILLAAPAIAMLLFPALCLAPSVVGFALPSFDHCLEHADHPVHLCFVHMPSVPGLISTIGVGLAALLVGTILAVGASHALRSARLRGRLDKATVLDGDIALLSTPRPVAFTLGIRRPRIFVGNSLRGSLTDAEWAVVEAHERCHLRRRDPLRRLVLQALSTLHLPHVRRRLLALHELGVEQSCDLSAAEPSGDRLLVAETLLRLERLAAPAPPEALGASHTQLEARVEALLEQTTEPAAPIRHRFLAVMGLCLALVASPLHHAAEHLLGHWLF